MTFTLPLTAPEIAGWMPVAKGFGFFLATFVLEDVATAGAGLLLATGGISWPLAFTFCFLGIWLGDAGLYALARYGGRAWFEGSSWKKHSPQVARSEQWFATKGTIILIFSRMLPGTRLPTYLAAGFLRVPLPRFLIVTGTAAFVWTAAILWLAQTFGQKMLGWLNDYKHGGLIVVAAGLILFGGLQLLRCLAMNFDARSSGAWVSRWRHWEFWPPWLFYPPVMLYAVWLTIKYRGLAIVTVANPGIFTGGMVGESKMDTLKKLSATSPDFTARAELIEGNDVETRLRSLVAIRARLAIDLPFILKPNLGQRGDGVKLIREASQAIDYITRFKVPLVVQQYAPGPLESGIFYYRFPNETRGKIFAITEKLFPVITGDGRSTVAELVWRDARARLIAGKYLKRLGARQGMVLAKGESLKMVEAGNHAQGCIFRDGMRLWTPELEARMDEISLKVTGFFIGRYDLRFSSEADLRAGKNFQIIELNGAASEATSIYDSRNSLWSAYRTLFRQWDLVFGIGAANRALGCVPTPPRVVWKAWRDYQKLAATYPGAD
jgi:membrane protein DedA with SNARE-associated domain